MIKSKVVNVNVHNTNKKYFNELNYVESNGVFLVKVEHLTAKSKALIDVKCDYCGNTKTIRYADHTFTINEYIKKDACENCTSLKREEILKYKIDNGLLESSDKRGKWKSKDLVIQELLLYIKKYGYIGGKEETNTQWRKIKRGIDNVNIDLKITLESLGYSIEDLQIRRENGYSDDFEVLKLSVQKFIDENDRFPSQEEMTKDLKIFDSNKKHGNFNEIKIKMGYDDKNDLVDLNGFINKSRYEKITANYLILQNMEYKRERYPFKKYDKSLNYKSDFTFYLECGEEIHCEVWGGKRNANGTGKYFDYDETMKIKLELYKKYNIKLISIDPSVFKLSVKSMQLALYNIFKTFLNLNYIKVDNCLMGTSILKSMSDDDIYSELMKYSNDKNTLPTSIYLRSINKEFLHVEVLSRYDSYADFAEKYGTDLKRKNNNYWTIEKVFERFDYMYNIYDRLLTSTELRKISKEDIYLKNLDDRIMSLGGTTNIKLEYYINRIKNDQPMGAEVTIFVNKIILNKANRHKISPEQQEKAKYILSQLNTAISQSVS